MNVIRVKVLHFLAALSGFLILTLSLIGALAPNTLSHSIFEKFNIDLLDPNRFHFLGILVCIGFIYLIPHWIIGLTLPLFTGLLLIQNLDSSFYRLLFLTSVSFLLHPYFFLNGGFRALQRLSYLAMGLIAIFFIKDLQLPFATIGVFQDMVLNLCVLAVLGVFLGIAVGTNLAALTLGFSMIASASFALMMQPYFFALFTVFYLWSIALPAMQDRLMISNQKKSIFH